MLHRSHAALLVLCLLSACAAADPADIPGPASRPITGASGEILVGRFAMARSDLGTAANDLLAALAADPQNLELRQQAFAAAVMAGRPEALTLAQALPGSPAASLMLANDDVKTGNWRSAEARFAGLPAQGATQILQPLLRAWAEQGSGATDEALNTLRPFIEGTRLRGIFALHAAMINDLAGRTTDAARLYRIAMVESGGLNLRLGTMIASWQARSGQEAEARATIRATVQSSPELAVSEPAMQLTAGTRQMTSAADGIADSYLTLAAALQRQDATDFSLSLLRLALDLWPPFTAPPFLASGIQFSQGQVGAAAATLEPVSASDPLIAVVQLRRAQYADREGHTAEAQRQLEQLADEYKSRPEPLVLLAQMQRDASHFTEAADTYGQAIQRLGQPGPNERGEIYEQGIVYDRAHDWPHAEADLLRALQLSPDQPYVLNYLGYAWTEQGRNLTRARQMIERAVEQRPNDGSIVDSLGWVLLRQGDKEGAVRLLERAVELQPEDSTVNGHLGDAYMAVGRTREAAVQWRRALILNPDPQDVASLQAKLAGASPPASVSSAEHPVE